MIIPYQRLSPEALQGLLEEFATRDGTDYGDVEVELERKLEQAMHLLRRGEIVIVYDAAMESVTLVDREAARRMAVAGGQFTEADHGYDNDCSWDNDRSWDSDGEG